MPVYSRKELEIMFVLIMATPQVRACWKSSDAKEVERVLSYCQRILPSASYTVEYVGTEEVAL